ncbi:Maf family protein [Virgibacillus soli]|uniref:dTTP/UTP pyrophosphatase n=1 Tax=Paracerasibacillus soli TaxID=480284 RepID=A0ABU5CM73_9BACI|nr:Maf family protein [Virgibacillus soli]MDY0407467.1 Maf family protein [Virgibacillus soli]
MAKKLILASSSPRRQELLNQAQIPFTVRKADTNESQITTNILTDKVTQLAMLKGREVSFMDDQEVILSADTVVSFNQQIYGKPKNKKEAIQMLASLSGNVHDVYTGVTIRSITDELTFVERTKVEFWPLEKGEIEKYVSSEEPYDKAGAYGIQSLGALFVKQIVGDYYNVVGLPISRVTRELRKFDVYSLN